MEVPVLQVLHCVGRRDYRTLFLPIDGSIHRWDVPGKERIPRSTFNTQDVEVGLSVLLDGTTLGNYYHGSLLDYTVAVWRSSSWSKVWTVLPNESWAFASSDLPISGLLPKPHLLRMASDLGLDGHLFRLWNSQHNSDLPFRHTGLPAYELGFSAELVYWTEPSPFCIRRLRWIVLPHVVEVQEAQNGNKQPRLLKLRYQRSFCKVKSYQIGNERLDKWAVN